MKRVFLVIVAALVALPAVAADPAEGYWKSFDDKDKTRVDAYWKVWSNGGTLQGSIVRIPGWPDSQRFTAFKPGSKRDYDRSPSGPITADTPIIGTIWMYDLRFKKRGLWVDGRIIHCAKGEVYGAEYDYRNVGGKEILEFRGYLLGFRLFKDTKHWERATPEELAANGITP